MTSCFFSRGCTSRARGAIGQIDDAVASLGIQAHRGTDVNEAADCTIIGVALQGGCHLTPAAAKMALVCVAVAYLAAHPDQLVTVEELQAILGHLAWIALLARPLFLMSA